MKDLFIFGRFIVLITFPVGLLFLFFNPFIGFLIIIGSIVIWNLCGYNLKKEYSLEEHNTEMAKTPKSAPYNPMNEKRLFTKSPQRELEILNDSAQLIETTKNPDTFFNRYDLYMEKLSLLANAEITGRIKVDGESLSAKLKVMNSECQKIDTINSFIDRMWDDTCKKANSLKTETGKQNCYKKFYDTLCKYEYRMPTVCIQHYKNFKYKTPTMIKKQPISLSKINEIQKVESSIDYHTNIYNEFHSVYSKNPYISQDRKNLNAVNRNSSSYPSTDMVDNNLRGINFEKQNDINAAITLYEFNVNHGFDGTHPYKRLAIIYRKMKDYDNEIRIIQLALVRFKTNPKVHKWYNDRLKKAEELANKKI